MHLVSFERQVYEGVRIQRERRKHEILNSKSEFNRCALPRLEVKFEGEDKGKKSKERLEEEKKKLEMERRIKKKGEMSKNMRKDIHKGGGGGTGAAELATEKGGEKEELDVKSSRRSRNKVENDNGNDSSEKMTEGKGIKMTQLEDDKLNDQGECQNIVKLTVVNLDYMKLIKLVKFQIK